MMETGWINKKQVLEFKCIQMEINMKDTSGMEGLMEKESLLGQMESRNQEIGKMEC